MSIGFISGGRGQRVSDLFSSTADVQIDVSLQNVLGKYDSIRTDLDRLGDRATWKTYDLTSKEHYNVFLKDAMSGWSETWYAEYRAVLALRADALQKKLQAAYNRVLDKSVFAEVEANKESVFAPYANRTFNGADVDNEAPYSKVFVEDMNPGQSIPTTTTTTTTLPPVDPGNWTQAIYQGLVTKYPAGSSDKDADGTTFAIETGQINAVRDPRALWGQYPYTEGSQERKNAFKYNNVMTPPWPTYYTVSVTKTIPASPIYYVDAVSGSYFNSTLGKIEPPKDININSGSYYNPSTGDYYTWNGSINGNGFIKQASIGGNTGGQQISVYIPNANDLKFVVSGQYYNPNTDVVNTTGGGGFIAATESGAFRRKASFALGGSWTDVSSSKDVREMLSVSHNGWNDITEYTVWVPDGSKSWDINNDGTADSLGALLDSKFYALFPNYPNLDPNGTHPAAGSSPTQFPADPNDALAKNLINPYLDKTGTTRTYNTAWDSSITFVQLESTPGMPAGLGSPFVDSRREAHTAIVRQAQIDAAIKATDDAIKSKNITDPAILQKVAQQAVKLAISALDNVAAGSNGHSGDPDQLVPFGLMSDGATLHPWGGDKSSPFFLGVDYSSILPNTDNWKSLSGGSMYSQVRQPLEILVDALSAKLDGGGGTEFNTTDYTKGYAGDAAPYSVRPGADAKGNYKIYIPMFGVGEVPIDFSGSASAVQDTLLTSDTATGAIELSLQEIQDSFLGRQYDDIIDGSKFKITNDDLIHTSMSVLPGWYATDYEENSKMNAPVTSDMFGVSDLLKGALLKFFKGKYKMVDGLFASVMGGTAIQVSGGPAEYGFSGADDSRKDYWLGGSLGPSIFYGHESAVTAEHDLKIAGSGLPPPLSSFTPGLPTIGIFGTHADTNIPVPIPIPTWQIEAINIPMSIVANSSYDVATWFFDQFMNNIREPVVESMQAYSYATSSGTAFDSYASRAEYHLTEPGLSEALQRFGKINFEITIPIVGTKVEVFKFNFGDYFDQLLFNGLDVGATIPIVGLSTTFFTIPAGTLSPDEIFTKINNVKAQERMFNLKHSVQAAEARETETGGFFATNAFLSQFELNNLESEYWIGTQQNEEMVNADLMRSISLAGKELLKIVSNAVFSVGSIGTNKGLISSIASTVIKMLLMPAMEANASTIIYDLFYKDQILTSENWGFISTLGAPITEVEWKTEGYDFIESDHKPFESDSDFNYTPSSGPLSFLNDLYSYGIPDFIMDGYANTRRFTIASGYSEEITASTAGYNGTTDYGVGPRAYAGSGAGDDSAHWSDTELGDINEVYVATRKTSFNNLTYGFNEFTDGSLGTGISGSLVGTRSTEAEATRYVGADSRIYGRRYDAQPAVNHESFNVGLYSGKTSNADSKGNYNRANQYNLSVDFKNDGSGDINLFGAQALSPTLGGFVKIATIDKNKKDDALLTYEESGVSGITSAIAGNGDTQQFGAATDGTLNELNTILYEHLHLRADGRNLSTINEYRDVFNQNFMKNVFITGQSYHPSGGGISSSLELRFDRTAGEENLQNNTREYYDPEDYNPYLTPFLTKTKGEANIYLTSYFAHKKRAKS